MSDATVTPMVAPDTTAVANTAAVASAPIGSCVVAERIRRNFRKENVKFQAEFWGELEMHLIAFVDAAIERAKSNGRTLVMARDL